MCTTVNCYSLIFAIITLVPEIVVAPSSVTVFSGNTAEFTCHTRNVHYATWTVNGKIVGEHEETNLRHNDVAFYMNGTIESGVNTTLTIKTRTKYHGLVIQCVAELLSAVVESENVTLMVQGTVELVGHVDNM